MPDTSNVFHVHSFPTVTNTNNIKSWFSTAGNTRIRWKDDTSAFVTVEDPEKARFVSLGPNAAGYCIETYEQWKSSKGTNVAAASPLRLVADSNRACLHALLQLIPTSSCSRRADAQA